MARILAVTITSVLLIGSAQAAANPNAVDEAKSKVVTFAGAKVTLPIPRGYCEISRGSEQGKRFYDLQEQVNHGINVVALLFVDCSEWAKREADPGYRIHRFGSYLLPMTDGEQQLAPGGYTRAAFIREIAGSKLDSGKILEDVRGRVANADIESGKINEGSVRPLAADENAAYLVIAEAVEFPNEKQMICGVFGMTLVKQAPVSMNLYRDYSGTQDILDLLGQQKRNLASLLHANE